MLKDGEEIVVGGSYDFGVCFAQFEVLDESGEDPEVVLERGRDLCIPRGTSSEARAESSDRGWDYEADGVLVIRLWMENGGLANDLAAKFCRHRDHRRFVLQGSISGDSTGQMSVRNTSSKGTGHEKRVCTGRR